MLIGVTLRNPLAWYPLFSFLATVTTETGAQRLSYELQNNSKCLLFSFLASLWVQRMIRETKICIMWVLHALISLCTFNPVMTCFLASYSNNTPVFIFLHLQRDI